MSTIILFFENLLQLSVEASPWLLLGILIAGLMKAWVPTKILSRHLGQGNKAIIKAAFIGAPLPLCSCGVIPVATELRRSGASAPATSAFLVATPETGIDSVSVSYALLGPIFAIYRPISAIFSAIFTGMLVATSNNEEKIDANTNKAKTTNCCVSSKALVATEKIKPTSSACCTPTVKQENNSIITKTLSGIRYSTTQLIDDLIGWLVIGLLFATVVRTFVPSSFLLSYGSGLQAMLVMIALSIPMYICATASTPVATGFIMAGPATNISTLGVIKSEMGSVVLIKYLLGISISAVSFGLLLDWGLENFNIDISQQMQHSHELLPYWFGLTCTGILAFLAIKPLRKLLI